MLDDHAAQDPRDGPALYGILEWEVVPLFQQRDAAGVPRGWVERVKHLLMTIGPRFCTQPMPEEYLGTLSRN